MQTAISTKFSELDNIIMHIKNELEGRSTTWIDDLLDDDGFFEDRTKDEIGAYDYLRDALDIEWIVDSRGDYLGARVLVAFGGPNIWINTRSSLIEGYWSSDECIVRYFDKLNLDDELRELYECGRINNNE